MLRPLEAEEHLSARTVGLLAGGHASQSDERKVLAEWKRSCQIEGKDTTGQALANAAAFGIGVSHGV